VRVARKLTLVAIAVTVIAASLFAEASVSVYYPVDMGAVPVEPPVWFMLPLSQANASIAANGSAVNVTVLMTSSNIQLIDNPDFNASADPWYWGSDSLNATYYYTDPDTGDVGIVALYGDVPRFSTGYAYIIQYFSVPVWVDAVNYSVRYWVYSAPTSAALSLSVVVYNVTGGAVVAQDTITIWQAAGYAWFNGTLTVNLDPYSDYAFLVWLDYATGGGPWWANWYLELRIDYAVLTTNATTEPGFYGELVRVNTTQNVTGRLVLEYYNVSGVTGEVYIVGSDGSVGAIYLNGTGVNATATAWVPINVSSNPLYVPARIMASVSGPQGSWAVLEGYLEYRVGGVLVRLPITINISS